MRAALQLGLDAIIVLGTRSTIHSSVFRRLSRIVGSSLLGPHFMALELRARRARKRPAARCGTRKRLEFEMSAKAKTDPLAEVASRYAVAITPAMDALIDPTNPNDPIAAQFRPMRVSLMLRRMN
jgi:hypothetical protein